MEFATVAPVPKKTNADQSSTAPRVTPIARSASMTSAPATPPAKSGNGERPRRANASASRPKKK